jgi:hypothetical protein
MNDLTQDNAEHATTDLPLQAQLMGSLALVFILSAIAGIVGYATYDSSSLEASARAKATMYTSNLTAQLYGAVATGDAGLSEELIQPLVTDRNVYGVAVYAPGGRRLAGHGHFPVSLVRANKCISPTIACCCRGATSGGQWQAGHVFLALSTEHIASARFRAAQFPAMTTAIVLLFCILLALAHSLQRDDVRGRAHVRRAPPDGAHRETTPREAGLRAHRDSNAARAVPLVVEGTQAIPFALDVEDGHFEYIGPQGPARLGFSEELWKQMGFLDRSCRAIATARCASHRRQHQRHRSRLEATVLTQTTSASICAGWRAASRATAPASTRCCAA